jgi:hypothetical protein
MPEFRVICVDGHKGRNKPEVRPFLVSSPEGITPRDQTMIKNWAMKLQWSEDGIRRWSNTQMYFTEKDAEEQPLVGAMFNALDWRGVPPLWFKEPSCPEEALECARTVGQPIPKYEHIIALDPEASFSYSCEIGQTFPLGERLMAEDENLSIRYADVHGVRVLDAEDRISKDDLLAEKYGKVMSSFCLWGKWKDAELVRSPVWICMFATNKGRVSENLHSAMTMFSFRDAGSKWVKKYFKKKLHK